MVRPAEVNPHPQARSKQTPFISYHEEHEEHEGIRERVIGFGLPDWSRCFEESRSKVSVGRAGRADHLIPKLAEFHLRALRGLRGCIGSWSDPSGERRARRGPFAEGREARFDASWNQRLAVSPAG